MTANVDASPQGSLNGMNGKYEKDVNHVLNLHSHLWEIFRATCFTTTIIKITNEGISFGRMVFIPPVVEVQRKQCQGALKLF